MKTIPPHIEKKARRLREELHRHDDLYFVKAEPVISDEEYDALMRELQDLEDRYPGLVSPDSPTQRVGGEPVREFPTVRHIVPMLSLANTYSEEDLKDFDRRVRGLLGDRVPQYTCELKFDGVSLSLRYEGGALVRAVTRGDGTEGDDITSNARTIRTIPIRLKPGVLKTGDCEVRGEVLMARRDFDLLNEERLRAGERPFVNPRNSTAGTLKLQDPRVVAGRPLRFYAWSFSGEERRPGHFGNLGLLAELGFRVDEHAALCATIDEAVAHWKDWEERRETLPFDVDGVVVKVDSLEQQSALGAIARSPRWAVACKFRSRAAVTRLKEIVLQVGRMGTITPVAVLEPVFLGGTTITRASLYNADYITQKDIRAGDSVTVERGGDVIPKVTAVVVPPGAGRGPLFRFPEVCPSCGRALHRPEGEVNYYCENNRCPDQVRGRIEHWAARGAMDIPGLGEANVDQLVTAGLVSDVADLYRLRKRRGEILELERWAEKSVDNLLSGIDESRGRPFRTVLFALGIRHVGAGVARVITDRYATLGELMRATREELEEVPQIGPRIAESLTAYFSGRDNTRLLDRLRKAGLDLGRGPAKKKKNGILEGMTFVLTGTLRGMPRSRAKTLIESLGGVVAAGVSGRVDVLIAGDDPGSKLEKARALGVEVWDEATFNERVKP